ncbi:MAG: DUF4160 domain-containing protein [Acidobacteriota bacterium]|jgi:hypothetical protein|nr:DUF4160 domain-containing protein [Acidobacteriota bacterium]
MPAISMFFGIIISMYYRDHLPPHFHAEYQGHEALFGFNGEILEGDFPSNKARMVAVWAEIHQEELVANWQLATQKRNLFRIEPLR